MCHTSHMLDKNDTNQILARITKDKIPGFAGVLSPHHCTLPSNLGCESLRDWLIILGKKYGEQKKRDDSANPQLLL